MMKKQRYDLKSSPLFLAIEQGNSKVTIEELDRGLEGSVEIRDLDGNTPLIRVSFLGNSALVAELIKRGADVNSQNDIGYTALHFAAQEGHQQVAENLINHGAYIDPIDMHGNSPLSNAVYYEKKEIIALLLSSGANPDLLNKHGVSPRELAENMGFTI